jgi:hypothetical protein
MSCEMRYVTRSYDTLLSGIVRGSYYWGYLFYYFNGVAELRNGPPFNNVDIQPSGTMTLIHMFQACLIGNVGQLSEEFERLQQLSTKICSSNLLRCWPRSVATRNASIFAQGRALGSRMAPESTYGIGLRIAEKHGL